MKRERNYISRSCEKIEGIPSNDQHNCPFEEQQRCNIFLNPYNLWDVVPAALISLNHTNDRYCMSDLYPQPTIPQSRADSYPVFSSLRTMDTKRNGLRVSFELSRKLPTGWTSDWNNCHGWKIEWSLETRGNGRNSAICDELHLFSSLANCFSFLISSVCWCFTCFCFDNLLFLFPLLDEFEYQVEVHRQHFRKVTLP